PLSTERPLILRARTTKAPPHQVSPVDQAASEQPLCVLSSSTFSREGGIQRVTQMVLRLLRETWPKSKVQLLSLHDEFGENGHHWLGNEGLASLVSYQPCASSRLRYTYSALGTILSRSPRLVISDHAHLSVIPYLARSFRRFRWVSFVYH